MDGAILVNLDRYLLYMETLSETRQNITIKTCLIFLLQEKPDTEE